MTVENATISEEVEQNQENLLSEEGSQENKEKEWDKHRQELDLERANARKAREELSSVSELYDSANQRVESLEQELEQIKRANQEHTERLEAQRQEEQDKLDEMDPDVVDSQVIKNIQTLNARLKSQQSQFAHKEKALMDKIEELSNESTQLKNEREEAKRKSEHEQAVESVLGEVEESLKTLKGIDAPGQYRTEAMKLADDLVDRGERKRPSSILEGVKFMRECYSKVIAQHQNKKTGVSVDGGKGGVTGGVKGEAGIKPGSLADVKAQMLKDKSWKDSS